MTAQRQPSVLRAFCKLYLPIAAGILVFVSWQTISREYEHMEKLRLREHSAVMLKKEMIETEIASRISDAVFLADIMGTYLEKSNHAPDTNFRLESLMSSFISGKGVYDQIRFLSTSGMEVIRINMTSDGPKTIPKDRLQDKSNRDYFKKTMEIGKRHVFISRFDLNMEYGKVEIPRKPMLRLASPVVHPGGDKIGVVVLNYLGSKLIEKLKTGMEESTIRLFFTRSDGYWFIGPTPEDEWAFMFDTRESRTMKSRFPEAWTQMEGRENGQFETPGGMFLFANVYAMTGEHKDYCVHPEDMTEYHWKIISFLPPEVLQSGWRPLVFRITAGLLIVLAGIIWVWALSRVKREYAEDRLRENEEKVRAISESSLDPIIMIDSKDRISFWNPAAEKMFGYKKGEIMGKPLHACLPAEKERNNAQQRVALFADHGSVTDIFNHREFEATRNDGTVFPIEISVASFKLKGEWYAVGSVRDITERKQSEAKLRKMATTDGLTGLFSRRHFLELANREFYRAKRYGHTLSMMMIDADHFKTINDNYGHDAGDRMLKLIADIGTKLLRKADVFGRIGGEEFAVIFPDSDRFAAITVAERFRAAVESASVSTSEGKLSVAISIGVAVADDKTEKLEDLMKAADTALYLAKEKGRNRVEINGY